MSETEQLPPAPSRPLVIVFAVVLVLALGCLTRAWHASIRDRHDFRQYQTALSAHWMQETGYKLDYETPVFGPPWSVPMEFPVYQWVVATTSRTLGTSLEATARGVSLGFYLATLPAVYLLAGIFGLAPSRRLLVVAVVLATPVYLFYPRTVMIETTALCCSTWFLYALARAVRDTCIRCAVGCTVFATLAALAKATTFLIFLPPAAVLFLWLWLPHWRRSATEANKPWLPALLGAIPVLASVLIAVAWVKHSDFVKDSNPYSGFLTARELTKWNWGTFEQRTSWRFWLENWRNVSEFVLGAVPLAVLLLGTTLVPAAARRIALAGAASFLGGVLLFSNLFYHHDYYYCANALLLAVGAGVLLAAVWDNVRLPLAARLLVLGLFFGGQGVIYYWGYGDYTRRVLPGEPELAAVIRETVPTDGVVVVYGWDWNALMPYYAQRRMLMVPDGQENALPALEAILAKLPPRKVAALLVHRDDLRGNADFVRWRTDRFQFAAQPFARAAEGDLYLPADLMSAATEKLRSRHFDAVTLATGPAVSPNAGSLKPVDLAKLDLPMLAPRPVAARSMFGLSTGDLKGRTVLLAHPESELTFAAPPGATTIEADFGLNEAAYAPTATAVTDGVTAEIIEQTPDGSRRVLFHRHIDPRAQPADRGAQAIHLAGPFTGSLLFRITPGPANNLDNDWAYWGHIAIR